MVAVISQSGKPLMPTSEYRARRRFESGHPEEVGVAPRIAGSAAGHRPANLKMAWVSGTGTPPGSP